MGMNEQSQEQRILAALQAGRKLTCVDILRDLHCLNAKGRLHTLRKTHPEIEDEWITTEGGARVKRWFINILMCKGNGRHNWSLKKESCECGELNMHNPDSAQLRLIA